MADLLLYNTYTGKKEHFKPIRKGHVGLYVCGITPYDEAHIGHARCYLAFDVLRRFLEFQGLKVRHIQNYTDIDDKIIERSKKEGIPPQELAGTYIASFEEAMNQLNVKPADEYPRVSQHIPEIIEVIKTLVDRGFAYEVGGSVYFSVRKFTDYGKLSRRNIDECEEGARVEVDQHKQDPLDFALWKSAKEGEPSWASPWGRGRPGWHMECSVMSTKYLGDDFDIHGGGQDLIFPHHENEIAQSICATGKGFAHVWVHNGFVTINEEKMSKSLGNFFTLKEVLAKTDPMVLRYFLISQHYKTPLGFSDQALVSVERVWTQRICGAYHIIRGHVNTPKGRHVLDPSSAGKLKTMVLNFYEGLRQDLNTSMALGALNQFCTFVFELDKKGGSNFEPLAWKNLNDEMDSFLNVLGLVVPPLEVWDEEILELVQKRQEARSKKDWAASDQLREELKSRGVIIEDSSHGPRLKRE